MSDEKRESQRKDRERKRKNRDEGRGAVEKERRGEIKLAGESLKESSLLARVSRKYFKRMEEQKRCARKNMERFNKKKEEIGEGSKKRKKGYMRR